MINNNYAQLDDVLRKYYADKPDFSIPVKINHAVKRTLDIILGSVGLIASIPIIAAMSVATLYDAGSPAFFRQERIGYHGKHITIYKIRVMHNGTEEKMSTDEIAISDVYDNSKASPVYTRVGRLLDRTHLNELPQLWNVIKGDMSIVGNRPTPQFLAKKLMHIDGYLDRFGSMPGLLGYSQLRPELNWNNPERILEARKYSKIYTTGNVLLEDLKIMCKTVNMYYKMCTSKKTTPYNNNVLA